MPAKVLHVFLHGDHLGTLRRGTAQTVTFQFDRTVPLEAVLSLSLPTLSGKKYSVDKA